MEFGIKSARAFVAVCLRQKVTLPQCLVKHHVMKTCGRVEVQLHAFLTSALYGGEWSASRRGRFTPSCYPLYRWLGGPQSRSGRGDEEKNSHHCPWWELNPGCSARSLVNTLNESLSNYTAEEKSGPTGWLFVCHIVSWSKAINLRAAFHLSDAFFWPRKLVSRNFAAIPSKQVLSAE